MRKKFSEPLKNLVFVHKTFYKNLVFVFFIMQSRFKAKCDADFAANGGSLWNGKYIKPLLTGNSAGKTALLVDGARRVGKRYIAAKFAKTAYKSYILIDFNIFI